jgi:6-pyruvoyl-tetrahydropterin synthase
MKTKEHQFLNPLAPSSMYPLEEGKFKGFTIHLPDTVGYKKYTWSKVKYDEKYIDEFWDKDKDRWTRSTSDNLPKWIFDAIMSQMNKKNLTPPVWKAYETVMDRIKDGKIKEIKLTPQKYETGSSEWHQSKRGDEKHQTIDPKYWK